MSFSENLKSELEYKGMFVKELSHKTGIPKQTIDKYLLSKGKAMPPADKAVRIAQALGVTVEYLVTGKEPANKKTPGKVLSAETRSIADTIEPLPREKRKIVEKTVKELVKLLKQPAKNEPVALSPLQKVFLKLFKH